METVFFRAPRILGVLRHFQNEDVLLFYSQGIVDKEFLSQGQLVNQNFYSEVLERLHVCETKHFTCGCCVTTFLLDAL